MHIVDDSWRLVICRQINVLLGGLPQYSHDFKDFNSTVSYYSDDYTWCTQRANLIPLAFSFFRIATPAVWVLVVGLGYVNGLIIYLLVQLDPEPRNRNLDLHHTIYQISLSSWIGMSQRFHPKHWPLRLYYLITLLCGMVLFTIFFSNIITSAKNRIRAHQVHSIAEMIEQNFRLAGSSAIFDKIQNQPLVSVAEARCND